MKHITKNRPQMVSITKLYLILRKKLLFVSVLPIEKARSYRITIGITEVILTGFIDHVFYALFFARKQTSILTLKLSVLLPCIRQQIKGKQSDEIQHSSLINSKPHEVKIHRYALHSHYKYKQMSWRKKDEEERIPDLRLGNVFQLPSRRISRKWTRSGTKLVIFLEALCAQN